MKPLVSHKTTHACQNHPEMLANSDVPLDFQTYFNTHAKDLKVVFFFFSLPDWIFMNCERILNASLSNESF